MQSTRQRILDYLDQHGTASPRQLAQAFGMTAANLRHHLGILQQRGLVNPTGQRASEGRGRPERVYTLTATAQGVQTKDTDCPSLSLDNTGAKTPTSCWSN